MSAGTRALRRGKSESSVQAALRRVLTRTVLILSVILLGFGAITLALWGAGTRDSPGG